MGPETLLPNDSSILAWRIPCTEEPGGLQSKEYPRAGVPSSAGAQTDLLVRLRTPGALHGARWHCVGRRSDLCQGFVGVKAELLSLPLPLPCLPTWRTFCQPPVPSTSLPKLCPEGIYP